MLDWQKEEWIVLDLLDYSGFGRPCGLVNNSLHGPEVIVVVGEDDSFVFSLTDLSWRRDGLFMPRGIQYVANALQD